MISLISHVVKVFKSHTFRFWFLKSPINLGYDEKCDIEKLAANCNSNPHCRGFNTNGLLKSCASGCEAGCCYDVTQNVDLYIRKGFLPPDDWEDDINHGRILFANPEPHFCFLPEVGNGYVGTVAMSAALFQSGLFNGKVKK
jgi:hypothetical protein